MEVWGCCCLRVGRGEGGGGLLVSRVFFFLWGSCCWGSGVVEFDLGAWRRVLISGVGEGICEVGE